MKKVYTKLFYILPVLALLIFYACKPIASKFSSPAGYNLEKPDKFNMPESLLDISGITFFKGKTDTVYSILYDY
jgi:hypothetical protein